MTIQYTYVSRKVPGRQWVYESVAAMGSAQDAYAWRRGVREYADNYHASHTDKGLVKGKKIFAWGSRETDGLTQAESVAVACDEALARFNAGDVPGERPASDPKSVDARRQAAVIANMTPEERAAYDVFMANMKAQREAAKAESAPEAEAIVAPASPAETKKNKRHAA